MADEKKQVDGITLSGKELEEYQAMLKEREGDSTAKAMEAIVKQEFARIESANKEEFEKIRKENKKALFDTSASQKKDSPWGFDMKAALGFQKQVKAMWNKNKDQYLEALSDQGLDPDTVTLSGETQNEGTNADGLYAVAPVYYTDPFMKSMKESVLSDCNVIPVSTNRAISSEFLSGVSVSDVAETVAGTHSKWQLDQIDITIKDTRASTVITRNLLDDAPQLWALTQKSYAEALKTKWNQVVFTDATGSSKNFNGMLSETVTDGVTTGGAIVKTLSGDVASVGNTFLNEVVHSLSEEDWYQGGGAKWYFNDGWSTDLEGIKDDNNRPLLFDVNGAPPTMMKGFKISRQRVMPYSGLTSGQRFAAFGNLGDTCHVWMRMAPEFAVIREGTVNGVNCGEQRCLGLVMFMRYAFKVYVRRYNDAVRTGLTLIAVA